VKVKQSASSKRLRSIEKNTVDGNKKQTRSALKKTKKNGQNGKETGSTGNTGEKKGNSKEKSVKEKAPAEAMAVKERGRRRDGCWFVCGRCLAESSLQLRRSLRQSRNCERMHCKWDKWKDRLMLILSFRMRI
jgi:hypothetical protein